MNDDKLISEELKKIFGDIPTNRRRQGNDMCAYSVLCREDKEQLDRIEKIIQNTRADDMISRKKVIEAIDKAEYFSFSKVGIKELINAIGREK